MAERVQLDTAADMVGKSEVTIRRLVKAGRVSVEKSKTLTGFIYKVDPDEVIAYYRKRGVVIAEAMREMDEQDEGQPIPAQKQAEAHSTKHAVESNGRFRVAISGESGDPAEYWLRRAEIYEEKYQKEASRHAEMREELGLWRGRAEHAQALLMKLLPAPSTIEVAANAQASSVKEAHVKHSTHGDATPAWLYILVGVSAALFLFFGALLVYTVVIK